MTARPVGGGSGVPSGGTTGQVLKKNSNTDGDASWSAESDPGVATHNAATTSVHGIANTANLATLTNLANASGLLISGAGAPSSGTGQDGQFYVDTTNNRLYGPKTSGAWGSYQQWYQSYAYNLTDSSFRNARFARARGASGGSIFKVMVLGDSISNQSTGVTDATYSWTSRLTASIQQRNVFLGAKQPGPTGTWVQANVLTVTGTTTGGIIAGSQDVATTGTIAITGTGDRVLISLRNRQGISLSFDVKVDGVTTDSFTIGATANQLYEHITTFTQGTHTITLVPTTATVEVLGMGIYTGDVTKGVVTYPVGNGGYSALDWVTITSGENQAQRWITMLKPDLLIVELGTNEYQHQNSLANFQTSMASIIGYARGLASPADVVHVFPGPQTDENLTIPFESFRQAAYSIAVANNTVLVDLRQRWGTRTQASGLYYDANHPNDQGHQDMANAVGTVIE